MSEVGGANLPFTVRAARITSAFWLVCACSCAKAPGNFAVTVYGQKDIEEGLAATRFIDGWAVSFDHFAISIGELSVASGHADPAAYEETAHVVDLVPASGGKGHPLITFDVPGGNYDLMEFTIMPADVSGAALSIAGTATRQGVTKHFDWAFGGRTRYAGCHINADVNAGTGRAEITILADHLFFDDLVSPGTSRSTRSLPRIPTTRATSRWRSSRPSTSRR
jgi:hypothetical protein